MKLEISLALFVAAGVVVLARWLHPATFSIQLLSLLLAAAAAAICFSLIRQR